MAKGNKILKSTLAGSLCVFAGVGIALGAISVNKGNNIVVSQERIDFKTKVGSESIELEWGFHGQAENFDHYKVQIQESNGPKVTLPEINVDDSTFYTAVGLKSLTNYNITVRSFDENNEFIGYEFNEKNLKTQGSIDYRIDSDGSFEITWNESDLVDHYELKINNNIVNVGKATSFTVDKSNASELGIDDLNIPSNYDIDVTAYLDNGETNSYEDITILNTTDIVSHIETPEVSILGKTSSTISIDWNESNYVDHYNVKIDGLNINETINVGSSTRYTFFNLTSDQDYTISVEAIDYNGNVAQVSPDLVEHTYASKDIFTFKLNSNDPKYSGEGSSVEGIPFYASAINTEYPGLFGGNADNVYNGYSFGHWTNSFADPEDGKGSVVFEKDGNEWINNFLYVQQILKAGGRTISNVDGSDNENLLFDMGEIIVGSKDAEGNYTLGNVFGGVLLNNSDVDFTLTITVDNPVEGTVWDPIKSSDIIDISWDIDYTLESEIGEDRSLKGDSYTLQTNIVNTKNIDDFATIGSENPISEENPLIEDPTVVAINTLLKDQFTLMGHQAPSLIPWLSGDLELEQQFIDQFDLNMENTLANNNSVWVEYININLAENGKDLPSGNWNLWWTDKGGTIN